MAEERDIRARLEVEKGGDLEAPKRLAEDVRDLGDAAKEAGGGLSDAAAGSAQAGRGIDAVTASFLAASDAVARFKTEADFVDLLNDIDRVEGELRSAEAALEAYEAQMKAAAAAGEDLGEEATQRLRELNAELDEGKARLAEYQRAQAGAGEAAKKTAGDLALPTHPLRDLDDLLGAGVGKWAKYLTAAGAYVATFAAMYQQGLRLRDLLNEITDGGFDRLVQAGPLGQLAEYLAGVTDEASQAAERYKNNLQILRAEGIDPTGKSVLEVDQLVQGLGKSMSEQRQKATDAAAAHREWRTEMGLSTEELDKQTTALLDNIARFAEANAGLSHTQLAGIFGSQIREILDGYARLGVAHEDQRQDLLALAETWGILSTKQGEAAEKQKALISNLREQLGLGADLKKQVLELGAALPQALEGLNLAQQKALDPEQYERSRVAVQAWVDQHVVAGVEVPRVLAQAAFEAGVYTHEVLRVLAATQDLGGAHRDLHGSMVEVVIDAETGKKVWRTVADEVERTTEKVEAGTEGLEGQAKAAGEVESGMAGAGDATRAFGDEQAKARSAADHTAEQVGGLEVRLSDLAHVLQLLPPAFQAAFAGGAAQVAPVLGALDQLLTKAQQVLAALQAIQLGAPVAVLAAPAAPGAGGNGDSGGGEGGGF